MRLPSRCGEKAMLCCRHDCSMHPGSWHHALACVLTRAAKQTGTWRKACVPACELIPFSNCRKRCKDHKADSISIASVYKTCLFPLSIKHAFSRSLNYKGRSLNYQGCNNIINKCTCILLHRHFIKAPFFILWEFPPCSTRKVIQNSQE